MTGQIFRAQTIQIDSQVFVRCKFFGCRILYAGGNLHMTGCEFYGCRFILTGPAANTITFLSSMNQDPGGDQVVEAFIRDIRSGWLTQEQNVHISPN